VDTFQVHFITKAFLDCFDVSDHYNKNTMSCHDATILK